MIDHDIEIRPDYVAVVCSGIYSELEDLERMFAHALEVAAEANQPKILVDFRPMRGQMEDMHRFFIGRWLATRCQEYLPDIQFQIACLGNYPFISPQHHAETVFRNRGGHGLVTNNPAEAEEWLGIRIPVGGGNLDH